MTKRNKIIALALLVISIALVIAPVIMLRDAEFGGSDDAGSVMVEEVIGEAYEPWATPVFEQMLGGELPGELESLLFCVQTGIGVGIIAFLLGRFVERKRIYKEMGLDEKQQSAVK